MSAPPEFSIVIPLYNKASFVERALASLVAQHVQDWEVIVVDDGSSDDGPTRVERAAAGDSRVRLIRQANQGVSVARNTGLVAARGGWVGFLDADDEYLPDYLSSMKALAQRHGGAEMLCAGYRRVWADGRTKNEGMPGRPLGAMGLVDDFFGCWVRGSFTHTNSIMVKRACLASLSPWFPPGERLGEDQDFWFRIAERCTVAHVNLPLTTYYLDVQGSATQVGGSVTTLLPCYLRLEQRLSEGLIPVSLRRSARRLVASHRLNVARARMHVGRRRQAWSLLTLRTWLDQPWYAFRTFAVLVLAEAKQ